MATTPRRLAIAVALLLAPFSAVADEPDVAAGERLYKQRCATCHYVTEQKRLTGPHLVGLFGRRAGSVEGFGYSEAMRSADVIWTEVTLSEWLRKPRRFIEGNSMTFYGMRDAEERRDLIAYLRQASEPGS